MGVEIEGMISSFEAAARGKPDYAFKLVGLAEAVALAKAPVRAAELARRAIAMAPGEPAVRMRARRLLGSLLPGYHVPMMNDGRRNAAWDRVLRRAIEPGILVFEIGTGAGMLAMIAARAGAQVVTCEVNEVAAEQARALASRNGLSDRISVVSKDSRDVKVGVELPRKADLLVCDIFGDELLTFAPLPLIHNARERLLTTEAAMVPKTVSFMAALAFWSDYSRTGRISRSCGFDLEDFTDFVPAAIWRPIDVRGLQLLSDGDEALRFGLATARGGSAERGQIEVEIRRTGVANAIVRWIRLELDDETSLEARPDRETPFFSGLTIAPLPAEELVDAGDRRQIGVFRNGRTIDTWLV